VDGSKYPLVQIGQLNWPGSKFVSWRSSLSEGRLLAIVLSSAVQLVEIIPAKPNTFPDRPELFGFMPERVHLHPGILFGIPEHRSESSRNRVHLAPESSTWTERHNN
jgi:hypothetical protein